jgi:hypothetical protein
MIAHSILVEFDEPHHASSRQSRSDAAKQLAAQHAGFKVLRLDLSQDVVDAIVAIETMLEADLQKSTLAAGLAVQRAKLNSKAKDFANEITNFNIKRDGLSDEPAISHEHVKNNRDVRNLLGQRGIRPEQLPAAEDIKKIERRVASETKKLPKPAKKQTP